MRRKQYFFPKKLRQSQTFTFFAETLTYHYFVGGDAVVRVDDEVLGRQGRRLLELGGQEHADAAEQLELGLAEVDFG